MPQDFTIRQGDTLPALEAVLVYENGVAIDLTGTSVVVVWKPKKGPGVAQRRPAVVAEPLKGRVIYEWVAGETAPPNFYFVAWEVTFGNGKILTVPTSGFVTMEIVASI